MTSYLINTFFVVSVALSTLTGVAHAQLQPVAITFPSEPSAAAQQNVVLDNFLGISWELSSFDTLWGTDVDAIPPAMQNYLSNVRARMTNPLRTRVGGNSMDDSTYTPSLTSQVLEITDSNAYFNDIPVDFGPVFFDVLNAMEDQVGSMQFILTLSMQDPDDYSNDIEVALAAQQALGDSLDALLLGNEPDLYQDHGDRTTYNISDYIPEVGNVLQQFVNASALDPNTPLIGGPTVCCDWDLADVISAGLDNYPYKYYTIQHYPANVCNGVTASNTNITYFITHSNVLNYVWWDNGNWEGIELAAAQGVPLLLTEYNSVSCGGSNISDTFAMALWATDVALQAAGTNFTAVFIHTREFNVTYNLFDPPSPTASLDSGWHTGPIYYSTLVLAEAISANGSVVVDLQVQATGAVAYAIYDQSSSDGSLSPGKLVLFNYQSSDISNLPSDQLSRTFQVPSGLAESQVAIRYLLAPNVTYRTPWPSALNYTVGNVSWAGQIVGDTGEMTGSQDTQYVDCESGCNVTVPAPGLALVWLMPNSSDALYDGNSTIAAANVTYVGGASRLRLKLLLRGREGSVKSWETWTHFGLWMVGLQTIGVFLVGTGFVW